MWVSVFLFLHFSGGSLLGAPCFWEILSLLLGSACLPWRLLAFPLIGLPYARWSFGAPVRVPPVCGCPRGIFFGPAGEEGWCFVCPVLVLCSLSRLVTFFGGGG